MLNPLSYTSQGHWLILVCALTRDWTCNLGASGQHSNQLSYLARAHIYFLKKILYMYPCVCTHTGKNSRRIYTRLLIEIYLWRGRIMGDWKFLHYISLFPALYQFVIIMHYLYNLEIINIFLLKKILGQALAGIAQWIEHGPVKQRVAGSIPSQGTCLGCRPGPQ